MQTYNSPITQIFSFLQEIVEVEGALLHLSRPESGEQSSKTHDAVLRIAGWDNIYEKTGRRYNLELDIWTRPTPKQMQKHFAYIDEIMDRIINIDPLEIGHRNISTIQLISSIQYDTEEGELCLNSGILIDLTLRLTTKI